MNFCLKFFSLMKLFINIEEVNRHIIFITEHQKIHTGHDKFF
jgi:hypothetical protein